MKFNAIIQKIALGGSIAALALVASLVWRTALQRATVMPSAFENKTKYEICVKQDGCVGFWDTTYRYDPSIKAWIPVLNVGYPKTGKYNAQVIRAKLKAEMEKHAEIGLSIQREARMKMDIQFTMDKTK